MQTNQKENTNYASLATESNLDATVEALKARGFEPVVVNSKDEALETIKSLIPAGATLMNGASVTLQEIGFVDLLKSGKHAWNNLHDAVLAETDKTKQALLRRQSVVSDFYLGSVHALSQTGEILIASNSGSQLPHLAFTSPNIILVVGTQKITPTLADGFKRLDEYVLPLEDERMKKAYGYGTARNKTLILHRENPMMGRKIHVIIVKESLGF